MQKFVIQNEMQKIVDEALVEDCAFADVTSDLTLVDDAIISFAINAREEIVVCGLDVIDCVLSNLMKAEKFHQSIISIKYLVNDGDLVDRGQTLVKGMGNAKLVLAAERLILNMLQHLSGISTKTHQFVKLLNNPNTKILDTRKTLPNLRVLQKYAVKMGGGKNHRQSLSDMILVKDNHIAANGGVALTLQKIKAGNKDKLTVEVECDNLKQVEEVLKEGGADIIMLDNMNVENIKKAQKLIGKKAKIEISGNVSLENIADFSDLNVDFVSIGSLTHSVKAVDIGLDIV